jgi:hypothetical protein
MAAALREILAADHARLDELLRNCAPTIDPASYAEFREGLLRHIGIEERILFPELRKHHGVIPLEQQLHRDHAALTALLVPPPSPREIEQLAGILERHNEIEESSDGLYDLVERLAGSELPSVLERVQSFAAIPVAPHSDTPLLRRTIDQLLREAEHGRR